MQCCCYYNTRTSSSSTHLSSISLDTHSSAFISLLRRKYKHKSKIRHKLHREYVTQAQLLAHLFRAIYLPWVTDLNGYSIQSNWNSHRRSDFFWSFLYTVEALQTDTLVSAQLYLWQPSQNFAFLNSHTNSVLLHSLRQPAPVLLRTPFLYPEGVHLWQLPLYVIHFISWTMKFRTQTLWQPENKIPWLFTDVVTTTETHFVFPWFSPWLWQPWCKWEVDDTDLEVWSAHTWHPLLRNMTWPLLK